MQRRVHALCTHHLQHWLKVGVVVLQPLEVDHQFVLLLHDALVMHLMEVALFAEPIPGGLGLVGNLLLTIHLSLHVAQLVT